MTKIPTQVYFVLHEDGSRYRNYSTGTSMFRMKGMAIKACGPGCKVVAYELTNPIVVHEGPSK
jgi:hypothetical protein